MPLNLILTLILGANDPKPKHEPECNVKSEPGPNPDPGIYSDQDHAPSDGHLVGPLTGQQPGPAEGARMSPLDIAPTHHSNVAPFRI